MDPEEKKEQRCGDACEALMCHPKVPVTDSFAADALAGWMDGAGLLTDPCICDRNPATTNGPEETCPRHGRPYEYWVEGCTEMSEQLANADKPDPCKMTHTEPFDFAQCETHDTTFALGDKCEWDGVESIYEHLENKVDEQRALKVLAQMKLRQIAEILEGPQSSFGPPLLRIERVKEILEGRHG